MPQAININGTTTRRPGVFATVDVSALSGLTLDINRVAVLGSFPMLEQAKVAEFSTAIDIAGYDSSDTNVATIAKLLYRPSTDGRIGGGPSATLLVSVNESTQAQAALINATFSKQQLVLKSKVWGLTGNRVTGAYNATDNILSLNRDGITESFTDLEDTGYIALYYNGSKADVAKAAFGPVTGVKVDIEWKIDSSASVDGVGDAQHITLNGSELDELAFDGALTFQLVDAGGVAIELADNKSVLYTITGTLKATGAAHTEALTLSKDAIASATTVSSAFSSITEIKIVELNADGSDAPITLTTDFKVTNTAFDLPAASYPKLQSIYDTINAGSATHKFLVSSTNPKLSGVYTNTIDELSSGGTPSTPITIKGAGSVQTISRNLQSIVDAVNNGSSLCTATRSALHEGNNVGTLEPTAQDFQLAGGSQDASESQADWDLAIDALKSQNVQIIVAMTDETNNSGVASSLVAHCKHMAGTGAAERCFWYGVPATTAASTATIITASKAINSRHGAMVAQQIKVYNHLAQLKTLDPPYLAVMLAGIQAGTGIAVPMTHKRIDVVDTVHGWDSTSKADQLIRNGVCLITQDRLGFRVERSVTTYLTDDNPVFSEVSANESLNTCIRDLRNFVVTRIGDQNVNGTAQLVRTIALTRLRQQVLDGIIKAFDANALQVVDLGDRLRIDARIAVVEPLNFIVINAEVVRNPTS
tara:strand:- start:1370 stop:3484 length:2115 start_codon:yes stop_codon:yes gene_type:complete